LGGWRGPQIRPATSGGNINSLLMRIKSQGGGWERRSKKTSEEKHGKDTGEEEKRTKRNGFSNVQGLLSRKEEIVKKTELKGRKGVGTKGHSPQQQKIGFGW